MAERLFDGSLRTQEDFLGMLGTGPTFTSLIKVLDVLFNIPKTYPQFLIATEDLRHLGSYTETEIKNTYRTLVYMSHHKFLEAQKKLVQNKE